MLKNTDFIGNAQIANIVKSAAQLKEKTNFCIAINVIRHSIQHAKNLKFHVSQIVGGNATNVFSVNFAIRKTFSNLNQ